MGAGAGVTVPLSGGRGVIRAGPEVVEAVLSVWRGGRWAEGPRGPPCSMSWSTGSHILLLHSFLKRLKSL